MVVVVPVTDAANVKRLYPSHAQLSKDSGGLRMDSVAKAEQMRTIQVSRFIGYCGRLERDALRAESAQVDVHDLVLPPLSTIMLAPEG